MKKIFIMIASIAIFGIGTFVACEKDEANNSSKSKNEIVSKNADDRICLGYMEEDKMFYKFNIEEIAKKLETIFLEEYNEHIILENMLILDSMPLNKNWKPELQISIFNVAMDEGATAWYYLDKEILDNDVVCYYLKSCGGCNNQPNFMCKQGNCKGTCVRKATYDDKCNILSAWCECVGDVNEKHHCKQANLDGNDSTSNKFLDYFKYAVEIISSFF